MTTANIKQLTLEDRPAIMDWLRRHPSTVSEITFTNLYIWSTARPVWFTVTGNTLVFLVRPREDSDHFCILGPPVGPWPGARRIAETVTGLEGWFRTDEATALLLQNEGLNVVPDENNADYVYPVSEMAILPGREYHAKRNLIRQCQDLYKCAYEPITALNLPECQDLQERWCRARNCGQDAGLCQENAAVREALIHFQEFELIGGLIRVDGLVQSFALAEELAPGTAVWHIEKAMPGFIGLGQLITHWFAGKALAGYEFVNREQDLGLPGLRQAKKSWNPHHMVQKFSACYGEAVLPAQPATCLVDD